MVYTGVVVSPSRSRRALARGDDAEFGRLLERVEPPLRRALVAAYGPDAGRDVLADVLAWAWENLDRIVAVANPAGYLWRVGQTAARRQRRPAAFEVLAAHPPAISVEAPAEPWDEALVDALRDLTLHQRVAVVLVHAYGYPLAEAAGILDCSVSSLRNHLARGLDHVRLHLEGEQR
jgi:DNA-directed RNA polymerase specialized sigma24 family protein